MPGNPSSTPADRLGTPEWTCKLSYIVLLGSCYASVKQLRALLHVASGASGAARLQHSTAALCKHVP